MNAKFEKWFDGTFSHRELPVANDEYLAARSAWQAAIQSLEVKPELVELACVNAYGGWSNFHQHEREKFRKEQARALQAVLSALKEQAK